MAYKNQPSIIFIDEVDDILRQRRITDPDHSAKAKTELLIQLGKMRNRNIFFYFFFSGKVLNSEECILIAACTNLPLLIDRGNLDRFHRKLEVKVCLIIKKSIRLKVITIPAFNSNRSC